MAESATATLKRWAALKGDAATYFNVCQDIAERVVPHKSAITVTREPGVEKTEYLYDSTAVHACKTLAAHINGTMTPATQPWISFVMRDDELNSNSDVRAYLEDCARRIHKALRQSNFNTSAHELYWDLCAFGTGCMFVEEKEPDASGQFAGFRFTTVAVGKFVVAEDKDGRVDTVFRECVMSRRAVLQQPGWKIPDEFTAKADNKPDEMVTILHAVYPRRDRAYDSKTGRPKGGAKNMPWASCYILQEPKAILHESGFEENPFVVPRWSKVTGEVYGTGPSHIALPDIKTLNAFVMFMLQAIPLAMQPPLMERSDSVLGDMNLTPGGRNPVDAQGPIGDSLQILDTKYRPDIATDFRQQFADAIRNMYHANELQLREGPEMTATEVNVRYDLMQRQLGPTTGRLESEYLNPLTFRLFAMMARRGAFLPLPGVLQDVVRAQGSAAELDVEYEGPLARAQRTLEVTAQDRTVAFATQSAQIIAPIDADLAAQILDTLDFDKMIQHRADITGLSTDSLRSTEEVQARRATRAQAAEAQRQQTQMTAVTEMARNAAPLIAATKPATGKAA